MDHQALIQAYLEGELDEHQHAELAHWLAQSEANREAFVRASTLDTHIYLQLQHASLHRFLDQVDIHAVQDALDQTSADKSEMFAAAMSADSELGTQATPASSDLTLRRAMEVLTRAGGRLARQVLRRHAAPLGLVAVAVVALTLLLVFQDNDTSSQEPFGPSGSQNDSVVATLTAARNDQWTKRSFALGSSLRAGQTLSLDKGFVQITTNRGAIATIEGPCAVKMIDNDNGLELLRGKLVGHCPTQQSQGFLVRTPSTQVIDLGTEFGVEVDSTGETEIYVFTGLVALANPKEDARTADLTELTAGQGISVDRQGQTEPLLKADIANRFARSIDPGALYQRMILADKPVVYYPMDHAIEGVERNLVADRYHAKIFGNVSSAKEAGRSFFSLNESGDYLQTTGPIAELRAAESYTIECWVRATRYRHGSICEIIPTHWDNPDKGVAAARIETLGETDLGPLGRSKLRFGHYDDSHKTPAGTQALGTNAVSTTNYLLEQWVHVAAVKSGPAMTLYLDGEPVGQANEPENLIDEDLSIRIGKFFGTKDAPAEHRRQFIGQLDELAIYDHALPIEAIRARVRAAEDWSAP